MVGKEHTAPHEAGGVWGVLDGEDEVSCGGGGQRGGLQEGGRGFHCALTQNWRSLRRAGLGWGGGRDRAWRGWSQEVGWGLALWGRWPAIEEELQGPPWGRGQGGASVAGSAPA